MTGHTRIGTYKGQLVAVKEINKTTVDINDEEIRNELKQVSTSLCFLSTNVTNLMKQRS